MRIQNNTEHQTLKQVVPFFMEHYRDKEFLDMVREHEAFNRTRDSGDVIAQKILNDTSLVTIGEFEGRRKSRCIASTSMRTDTIWFNTRMLDLPTDQKEQADLIDARINTIMHEYVHTLGYTHRGNRRTNYNLKTAPYIIGDLFAQYKKRISAQNAAPLSQGDKA